MDKRALAPARDRVALDGVAARADEAVEAGELDDEAVPVVLVERALFEVLLDAL